MSFYRDIALYRWTVDAAQWLNTLGGIIEADPNVVVGYPPPIGIKLGPSGKPLIHRPFYSTMKAAKDAARAEGKGPPMKHPTPTEGGPHFHPVDEAGNKIPGVHYEYPE